MTNNSRPSWYSDMFDAQGRRRRPTAPTNTSRFVQTNPNTGRTTQAQGGQDMTPFYNDGVAYRPTGKPGEYEEMGVKTPEAQVDTNDYLAGWDYQNPPTDPRTGTPLDYKGDPLPAGATGFTPYGEPDFTPKDRTDLAATFQGWFKGIQYRLYKDVQFDEKGQTALGSAWEQWLHQENKPAWSADSLATAAEENLGDAWNVLMQLGPGLRTLQSEEGSPNALTMAGRTIAEVGRGIGSAFNLFSKTAESVIGTSQLTQKDLSEGSPLPEINYPDWVPGWVETLLNTATPLAAYNSLRVITAPKKSWDEVADTLAENWQASRIAYSVMNDDNLKEEYIRRYKAGEDPRYLVMELEKPLDEMIGQLIFDPLNVAGYFTKTGAMARRLDNINDIYLKPAGALDDAFRALKADNLADGIKNLEGLAQTVQDEVRAITNNLDELATNRGLMQLTTSGKRSDLANRSGQMIRFIFANTRNASNGAYDFDKAMEIIRGMINLTDVNSLDNVAAAVNDVSKSAQVPRPLFSRAGLELGIIMRNMLEEGEDVAQLPGVGRGLNFEKFLRGFEEARAGGIDEVIAWATNKLNRATEGYFPTVLEQARAVDTLREYAKTGEAALAPGQKLADLQRAARFGDVSELSRFVSRFDEVTKGKIYTPINRFFANVYMGMSPGFAFRNLMNNAGTIAVDAGVGSIFVGKETAVNGIKNLLGGITNSRLAGFGDAAKGVEGAINTEKGLKWYQFGLRWSENFEEIGAAQVSYKAVKDVMRQILQPGKALPDITPLINAGLPPQSANLLSRLVVEFDGNVNLAFNRFRELAAGGNIDITRTLAWLSNDDVRIAQNFNKWDTLKTILTSDAPLSEKQAALASLIPETQTFADMAKTEMSGMTDMLSQAEGRDIMATAANAVAEGNLTDAEAGIINHRIWANAYTRRAYEELILSVREQGWEVLRQSNPELANQVPDILRPIQDKLTNLWNKEVSAHDDFTRLVVARTKELKGSGGGQMNFFQMWEELKMDGDLPPNMSIDTMIDAAWNHWRNVTRDRFATAREAYVALAETGWQEVQRLTGYEPSQALLDNARNYLAQARAYDDAIVDTTAIGPMVFQKRDMILSALQRGDAKTAIAILADHYGIASASKGGKYFDNAILNTFRAYTGRAKGFTIQDALKPVLEVPDEFRALMQDTARLMMNELKEGGISLKPAENPKFTGHMTRQTSNPNWYRDLYNNGYKSKSTFISALQRIIDGTDGGDLKYLSAVKRTVWEQIQQESANYQEIVDILSGKGKKFSNLTIDEVWQAFEAQRAAKNKGPLIRSLDEYLGRGAYGVTQVAPAQKVTIQEVTDTVLRKLGTDSKYNLWSNVRDKTDYQAFIDQIKSPITQLESVPKDRLSNIKPDDIDSMLGGIKAYSNKSDRQSAVDEIMKWIKDQLAPDPLPKEPIPMTGQQTQLPLTQPAQASVAGSLDPQAIANPGGMGTLGPVQDTLPGFKTPGGATIGPDGKPLPLPTPYMDGSLPTGPRATAENQEGFKRWLQSLSQRLEQNTGKLTPVDFTPEVETALSAWTKQAISNVAEGRLLASGYADLMRDFALHDYGAKRNIDLVAAYVFPYEFWYTRTYKNWLTRLVTNPEVIAAYAKYRTALEKLHAGAPEWWKYNVNSNELLGRNDDNPLFFNLEATLNPLNGLTGIDFEDPAKRVDWLSRTVDDLGKFGPSTWTPINLAVALSLYAKGKQDAAARWAGRMAPQTQLIRTIGAIFNTNIEVDPLVNFFSNGQDPYEQKRAATALSALVQGTYVNGEWVQITEEQAIDAANPTTRGKNQQAQAIWDMATQYALDRRTLGNISSFMFGVGFKGRNTSELAVEKMYQDYYRLWNTSSMMSGAEFREQMEAIHIKYPWMDAILLAKKSGPEVDRALAYNVFSRIPPGQSKDILESFGLNEAMMQQFYDNKGDLSFMTATDRDRFMAGVIEIGAALALPADATRVEWAEVRNRYTAMQTAAEQQFGPKIWDRVGDYFMLQKSNPDAAKLFMANNPLVEQALSWRENAVMSDSLLFDYYGGLDFLDKYWTGQMYDAAQKQFGTGIFEVSAQYGALADQEAELLQQYYDLKDAGQDAEAKAFRAAWLDKDSNQKDLYLAAHPELKAYWDLKKSYQEEIQRRLVLFEDKIRDVRPELRPDYQPQGVYEIPAAVQLGYQFPEPPTFQDYAAMMSPAQLRLFEDYVQSGELSPTLRRSLETMAEQQGMSYQELLSLMEQAFYQEVATVQ